MGFVESVVGERVGVLAAAGCAEEGAETDFVACVADEGLDDGEVGDDD